MEKYLKMHKNKIFIERASKAIRIEKVEDVEKKYGKQKNKPRHMSTLMRFEAASSPNPKTVFGRSMPSLRSFYISYLINALEKRQ